MTTETERTTTIPDADGPDVKQMAATAKDESTAVGRAAVEGGREVLGEVADQVAVVADDAKEQFANLMSHARDELRTQSEARSQQVMTGLQTVSDQLSALMQGRPEEAGWVGTALSDLQQRVQGYVRSLQDRGPRGLVDDAASFARRRPGAFLLTASVTGFAVGRLVRSGAAASSDPSTRPSPPPALANVSASGISPGGTTRPYFGFDDGLPSPPVDEPGTRHD